VGQWFCVVAWKRGKPFLNFLNFFLEEEIEEIFLKKNLRRILLLKKIVVLAPSLPSSLFAPLFY
jgi:hypothetical protein